MVPVSPHRAEDLAARLPPLLVSARHIAATLAQGVHGRRRTGPGETFWQFRRAQPGDGPASIDWRRSARSDHLFVRETEWAAAQTIWLWRDASASMTWCSRPEWGEKRERAELLILSLAALLLRGGERVGLLAGGQAATSGLGALERLALALGAAPGDEMPPPRHATVVLASDFLEPLDQIERRLKRLAAHGAQGHLIQVLDPAEESLPYTGRVRFEGVEGEDGLLVRRAQDLRPAYARRLAAHRDGLAAVARALGWSLIAHRTDQPPQHALLALHTRLAERWE
ncbi:conserved hypothetical protein [Candidatus Terasakiella magnetica]|nr:conserved hypothetical protein [Candidatus Terasakiella magnetica]